MWDENERVLSRVTPRLLTTDEVGTGQWSMRTVGGIDLESVDLEPTRRISLLLPFNLRLLFDIQEVMVLRQSVSAAGGDVECGPVVM